MATDDLFLLDSLPDVPAPLVHLTGEAGWGRGETRGAGAAPRRRTRAEKAGRRAGAAGVPVCSAASLSVPPNWRQAEMRGPARCAEGGSASGKASRQAGHQEEKKNVEALKRVGARHIGAAALGAAGLRREHRPPPRVPA